MAHDRQRRRRAKKQAMKRGSPPGTPTYTGEARNEPVEVRVIDFDEDGVRELDAFDTATLAAYKTKDTVTWVNLDGIHQVEEVQAICRAFDVHPLWVEDIVNHASRSKAEMLDDRVMVVARMIRADSGDLLATEQVSIIMGVGWVVTFQERSGDVWEPLRKRIRTGNGRVRRMGSDYLLHALLDDIVDHYFLGLEEIEGRVDDLEARAIDPTQNIDMAAMFELKNELAEFRRTVWPMRESAATLLRLEDGPIGAEVIPFFSDLYDHIVQVMDILESSRERTVSVYELHLAVNGHRLNDIMKILTVVSTIFIPMTFVAGVYGMNFDHMPELHWQYGYAYVLTLMLGSALLGGGLVYSRRWLS